MIREVVLRRFKRFEEETFPLGGNVVLAGQNNSGKTTVLQAIAAWALAFEQWRLLNDANKHGGAYSRKPVARQAFSAVPLRAFDLLWHDRRYEGTMAVTVTAEAGWSLTMEFSADSTEQIYVRPHKSTPREVVQGQGLSVVYVSSIDGLEIEEAAINNPEWVRTLLGRQRPGLILRNLLLDVSRGDSWAALCGSVERLFGIELLVPQTPGGQIVSEYRRRAGGRTLDLMNAGSGLHQVLLLLACLYTRAGSVLLIDEPDAHLHVFLQDTILSELFRVAAAARSQLILATHSEVIFRSAPPEQLVVMMGPPRRLSSTTERSQLAKAMAVLEQTDILQGLEAPGVLYLEGHTDLDLLRTWASVLGHPLADYLDRTPFWKPVVWQPGDTGQTVRAPEHYCALQLVKTGITGAWLLDSDGRKEVPVSTTPEPGRLNRLGWQRYESESYLVHPVALARFIDRQAGAGGAEALRRFLTTAFERYAGAGLGAQIADAFIAAPGAPSQIVERYLADTKARTTIVGGILQEGGIHAMDYTRFSEIAAVMLPEEIHPEVKEKLDFIQQAFGL